MKNNKNPHRDNLCWAPMLDVARMFLGTLILFPKDNRLSSDYKISSQKAIAFLWILFQSMQKMVPPIRSIPQTSEHIRYCYHKQVFFTEKMEKNFWNVAVHIAAIRTIKRWMTRQTRPVVPLLTVFPEALRLRLVYIF